MKWAFINQTVIFCLSLCCVGVSFNLHPCLLFADEVLQKKTAQDENKPKTREQEKKELPKKDLKKIDSDQRLPVDSIIAEMRRAGELIENQETGKSTQKIQTEVVEKIEELIRQIESAQKISMQRKKKSDDQQQANKKQSQQMKKEQGQQKVPQLSQGPARKSSDRLEKGQVTTGNLPNSNGYIKDAWGHLPPAVRQQLLNIYTEKYLPQYEEQVRRYYEALAEKKKRAP